MSDLFSQTISDVESWADVYQDIGAFEPLAREIFTRHGLGFAGIENLTPGSNAVFKAGDKVVKIFAPVEAGFATGEAYSVEKQALIHVNSVTKSAPRLLFSGAVEDKYLFSYIIMDYIEGQELHRAIETYSARQKRDLALHVKGLTDSLNIVMSVGVLPEWTKSDCVNISESSLWNRFSESFLEDRRRTIENVDFSNRVYVHGDIKAANVIIGVDGTVHIIDFADSLTAPPHYEWPFIVFGLFGCDRVMMEAYFGDYDNEAFYSELTRRLITHKFGAGIILQLCELTNTLEADITSVDRLGELLTDCVRNGDVRID